MGVFRENRIAVEIAEELLVARVREVVDDILQHVADDADDVVVARTEEHFDGVRQVQQLVLLIVVINGAIDAQQMMDVGLVDGVFDDDFLAADVSVQTQSE